MRYKVKGYSGIAFFISGYPKRWEPEFVFSEETEKEYEIGGEWIEDCDSDRVLVTMVGDDYKYEVDKSDLTPIDELDYCAECGQIGCFGDGRDRSEQEETNV